MKEIILMLASWFLALWAWFPVGNWLLSVLNIRFDKEPVHRLIFAIISGACINSLLLGLVSFWFPVNVLSASILAAVCSVLFWRHLFPPISSLARTIGGWSLLAKLTAGTLAIVTLLCTAHQSLNNDSGLYYIQFMKWMNYYPVVPGLANLHDRLGFNSHWHLLSAAYDLRPLVSTMVNDLNGLFFLLIGIGCIDSSDRWLKQPSLFHAVWAVFPIPLFLLLRFLTSAAPDIPSALLPLLYFSILLRKEEQPNNLVLAGLLIIFAATVKVVSVFHLLILVPFLLVQWKQKLIRPTLLLIGLGGMVAAVWMVRNVVLTGYPVFPLAQIDLFHFDWKVPFELVDNARMMISTHAHLGTYDLSTYGKPLAEWFPVWLSYQSTTVLGLLILVTAGSVVTLAISLTGIIFGKHTGSGHRMFSIFLSLTVVVNLLFWWESGPNPRFVYGAVFFFLSYSIASVLLMSEQTTKLIKAMPLLALLPMLLLCRTVLNEDGPIRPTDFTTMQSVLRPVFYPRTTDKCWDHQLPCANMNRTDIGFRGTSLGDGFVNTGATE